MPAYQRDFVTTYLRNNRHVPNFPSQGTFNDKGRAYPDVSALADNTPMVEQGNTYIAGGM